MYGQKYNLAKKSFEINRRKFSAGICALSLPFGGVRALAKSGVNNFNASGATALSGHRFRSGEENCVIANIISPENDVLLNNARQFSRMSRNMLQSILDKDNYVIEYTGEVTRWGDKVVRLPSLRAKVNSLQEDLIVRGAARVMPINSDYDEINTLLALEEKARNEQKGLWALSWYRMRDANNVSDARDCIGSQQIFSGRIVGVGKFGGRWFLNFGDDYKTDVTATIDSRAARQWSKFWSIEAEDLKTLEGQTVSFRGFVEWINGPSVAVGHSLCLIPKCIDAQLCA